MHKLLSDVRIFHETFGLPVLTTPTIPDEKRITLRLELIKEEEKELNKAIKEKDLIEIADALVDLMYVINGAILEFGIQKKIFDDSFDINTFTNSTIPIEPTTSTSYNKDNLDYLRATVKDLEECVKDEHMGDIIECFADLVEIVLILAIGFGLANYFYKCHDEVQASNMSKLDADGKPIYRADGKVIKGPNFFKPNLDKIINENRR